MVVDETFTDTAAALSYFDDQTLNLGSNSAVNVTGNLDLVFNVSLMTDDLGAGFSFDLLFGNSTFLSGLAAADFNADGDVDGNDFLIWQSGFGIPSGALRSDGDADSDEDVDGDDFLIWQSQFGNSDGLGASAVPEPSALLLGIFLALLAWTSQRRGRKVR